MSANPEIIVPSISEHFDPTDLTQLDLLRNDWGTLSLYAPDGSEFLNFEETWRKLTDYGGQIWEPAFYAETASPYHSPVTLLDNQMTKHWIARTTQFKSKVKNDDELAKNAIKTVVALSDNYEYHEEVEDLLSVVDLKVRLKKIFRTKSLLHDMNQCHAQLGERDVWLIAHQEDWSQVVTGKLAGFMLVGEGDDTVVEVIVENDKGVRGLFPQGSSLVPASYLKDDGLVKSLKETIF